RGDGVHRGLAACDLTRRRGDAEKDAENTYEKVKTWERGVSGDSGASRRGIRQRPDAPAHAPPLPLRSLSLCPFKRVLRVFLRVSASPRQSHSLNRDPHLRLASIITVEPAPHAASTTAKGSDATTSAK